MDSRAFDSVVVRSDAVGHDFVAVMAAGQLTPSCQACLAQAYIAQKRGAYGTRFREKLEYELAFWSLAFRDAVGSARKVVQLQDREGRQMRLRNKDDTRSRDHGAPGRWLVVCRSA